MGAAVLALLAACSSARRDRAPDAVDERPAFDPPDAKTGAGAPCEDWSTLECGIELGTHDNVVDCARGVRLCQNGVYGPCVADASLGIVAVQAPDIVLPPAPPTGTQSVGGTSQDCIDDVCNPFCQNYVDEADVPYEAPRVDMPSGNLYGGSLQSSNLPSGFKNKGSLDAQCSTAQGSETWNEACQFDQHCVAGACTAWEPGQFGDCEGVDITTPTTCVPSSGGTRVLTVCNRGTTDAPAGILCYGYSGGSPQFPNSDPGAGDRLLMTTQGVLAPGECETQLVEESVFHQNGIQSVACNPPQQHTVTAELVAYPGVGSVSTALLPWATPDQAMSADSASASVSPQDPNGASTGSVLAHAASTFGLDAAWSEPENALFGSPAGNYATASPAAPSGGSGVIGPRYAGGFLNPASSGDSAFASPDRIYAADGSYASATPTNPNTVLSADASPSTNDGSSSWSAETNTYVSDAAYATAKLTSAGTSDTLLKGFGLALPSAAIIDSFELHAKWKSDVNSNKYTLTAQALTNAGSTLLGSELTKSGTYTTETSDVLSLSGASVASVGASALNGDNLLVRLRFKRANGNVADATASVDHVYVVVKYHLASTSASAVYRYFGLGSIPQDATVQITTEVKWKASAVNPNLTLGLQLYENFGTTPTAIGNELTRVPAAANTDYVDVTTSTVLAAALIDTSFALRLRATRSAGAVNPDVTASIDYVRIDVVWSVDSASTTHSIFLTDFDLDEKIPENAVITSVTASAAWKLSTVCTAASLGLQAYTNGGATPLGSEVVDTTSPTSLNTASQSIGSGLTRSDLRDASFGVRVRVSRSSAAGATDFTAYLGSVQVVVTWTSPSVDHGVTFSGFGLASALPSTALVTGIKTEARWKSSVSSNRAELAFQLFSAGVPIGAEYVDSSLPTTMTTRSQTLTGLQLSPAQLSDFLVKVRATRESGSNNPDFTAELDYVRVSLTYVDTIDEAVSECNRSNNWTASKLNPSPDACQDMSTPEYVPFTVTRVFQGVCPMGQKPTWRRFGYTTSTPGESSVEFRFRSFAPEKDGTCPVLEAVTADTPEPRTKPLAVASASADPEVCLTTDPACVIDFSGGAGALRNPEAECLQMDASGVPTEQDSPELFDWTVLYDCRDAE